MHDKATHQGFYLPAGDYAAGEGVSLLGIVSTGTSRDIGQALVLTRKQEKIHVAANINIIPYKITPALH